MGTHDEPSVDEEAIQWFVALRDEDATPEDRRRFTAWLAADERHGRSWREVERLWGGLDPLGAPDGATANPRDAADGARRQRMRAPLRHRPVGRRSVSIAAVLLAALVAGWQILPAGLHADHRAGVGDRKTVELTDGSVVELGPESAMDVAFEPERRSVRLIAGEAFFTVAKDARRPFVVETSEGRITVLGTAFNVRIGDINTVAVVESTVEVSTDHEPGVRVGAGQMVHFDALGISPVGPADLEAITAWRQDQVVFRDAPLHEVVAELQRYHRGRIQIIGFGMADLRVTAVVNTGRVDAALDTIARSLDLRVLRVAGYLAAIVPI